MRSSYSQHSTYKRCPQHWHLRYENKLESEIEGASLSFGTAFDSAFVAMLKSDPNYEQVFINKWTSIEVDGQTKAIYDNCAIAYSHSDFDAALFMDKDIKQLESWCTELGLVHSNPIDLYKEIAKNKKNPYKSSKYMELVYYSRCNWLSLKLKGIILLQAIKEQFIPKVKKVVDVQKFAQITDPNTKDSIVGYLDMVVELEGYDKPVILDLKTASQPYEQDNLDLTEQLVLYSAMKSLDYGTDVVGYLVAVKNIGKDKEAYCSKCGAKKEGRHLTCPNEVDGKRCNGEWIEKTILVPQVQLMTRIVTQDQINDLLQDYSSIVFAMKNGIIYKNVSNCKNWFGSLCPFYKKCWESSEEGLICKKGK